jgi:hypothetical protein
MGYCVRVFTVATERAGTLFGGFVRKEVYQADEFPRLVDTAVIEEDYDLGVQRVVYAQDITTPHAPGWVPETVLVVTVHRGWGAAYYREHDDAGQGWAWITRNPRPSAEVPDLLFDPEAGANYPADAAIPVSQLRRAIEEYLRTGERPTCVEWKEADRYMIY